MTWDLAHRRRLTSNIPTQEQLVSYLEELFLIPVPDQVVVAGNQTPGDHARVLWRGENSTVTDACRDGFKTLVTAAIWFLEAHFYGIQILHFGAFERQAKQALEYLTTFGSLPWWQQHVRPQTTEIRFRSGGRIKCMPLTAANARSAHCPRVAFDEADECRPDARRIAINIASTRGDQIARTADLSTKNRPNGLMVKLKRAAGNGMRSLSWGYKEITERCPDWRSGTDPVRVYVQRKQLRWGHDVPESEDPEGWVAHDVFDGCLKCALLPSCRGDLKRAGGVARIDDLVQKISQPLMTPEEWHSQNENEDPSMEGMCFPSWDPELQLTPRACFDPRLPLYGSQDFGLDHLAVSLLAQNIPLGHKVLAPDGSRTHANQVDGRVHVLDEYVCRRPFSPDIVQHLAGEWFLSRYRWPNRFVIDPSAAAALSSVRVEIAPNKYRTLVLHPGNNKRLPGYLLLRGMCTPSQQDGLPKLLVNPKCTQLPLEMGTLRNKQKPDGSYDDLPDKIKGGDDACDTMRYLAMYLVGTPTHTAEQRKQAAADLMRGGFV